MGQSSAPKCIEEPAAYPVLYTNKCHIIHRKVADFPKIQLVPTQHEMCSFHVSSTYHALHSLKISFQALFAFTSFFSGVVQVHSRFVHLDFPLALPLTPPTRQIVNAFDLLLLEYLYKYFSSHNSSICIKRRLSTALRWSSLASSMCL